MHNISGVFSAALTPVKKDLSINKDLYLRHCQYLMRQGHDGLAIFGTTGEANSFSVQEKIYWRIFHHYLSTNFFVFLYFFFQFPNSDLHPA